MKYNKTLQRLKLNKKYLEMKRFIANHINIIATLSFK